ncbi:MAG: DUF11 domain-containing protein [Gammaproteobacteria bacterium]
MKRYSLILCLVLIVSFSGVASAQIVLGPDTPTAIGDVYTGYSTWYESPNNPYVGDFYGYICQGVIEFYLNPASVPTANMTKYNFTARLDGLSVTYSSAAIPSMNVVLYDMLDFSEDGAVTLNDLNSMQGGAIATRTHNFFGIPANFDNVDVTEAVRHDLFDLPQTDYSGFILIANPDTGGWVEYNDDPTLTITTGGGPPTDLAVSKTVNDTTPDEGQTITYTITLTNNGPVQATTVSITDLLPAGVTYVSETASQGVYVSGTGVWTVGTINNGASATLNIQATVDAGTGGSTITNLVTAVSLDQTDSNATPDDLSEAITVNAGGGGGGSSGFCFIATATR